MKQLCQNFILALKRNIDMYFFCVQKITRIYREGDKNIQLEILWKKIQQKIITYQKKKKQNKTKQNRTQIINGWQKDIFISWYCKRLIWKYWKLSRFLFFIKILAILTLWLLDVNVVDMADIIRWKTLRLSLFSLLEKICIIEYGAILRSIWVFTGISVKSQNED